MVGTVWGAWVSAPGWPWAGYPGLCPVTSRKSEPRRSHSWFLSPQNGGEFRCCLSLQLSYCQLVPECVLSPNTRLVFHRKRLKAKNLMYIKQILYLLEQFVAMLGGKQTYSFSRDTDRLWANWCFFRALSHFPFCRGSGDLLLMNRFRCQYFHFSVCFVTWVLTCVCLNPILVWLDKEQQMIP